MNQERRKFIKTACLCGGFLLLGKTIGAMFPGIMKSVSAKENDNSLDYKKTTNKKSSVFYDSEGNRVLIIEK
jgi:hypothetical protein